LEKLELAKPDRTKNC